MRHRTLTHSHARTYESECNAFLIISTFLCFACDIMYAFIHSFIHMASYDFWFSNLFFSNQLIWHIKVKGNANMKRRCINKMDSFCFTISIKFQFFCFCSFRYRFHNSDFFILFCYFSFVTKYEIYWNECNCTHVSKST